MAESGASREAAAKKYSCVKYSLAIIETAYLLILLFLSLALGLSRALAFNISQVSSSNYFILPAYILAGYLAYYILNFPFNFYQSFVLEHKFSLSKETMKSWFADQAKGFALSYILSLICLCAFYYVLARFPGHWWFIVSLLWILFSLILAKLVPVLIIPLFFKYKKLSDEKLRERIISLAQKMKVNILDVFEIDFSKKTLKANAAFVGWGSTRRVILADTLKDKYTTDEIEVILAHEFSHYRLKHLLKLVLISSCATIFSFFLIFKTNAYFLKLSGLSSLLDVAALPVILMFFAVVGIILQPLENYLSRKFETDADIAAIRFTGLKDAFISTMDKLASQNLSDRSPNPVIKLFFFDHPPIDERIATARSLDPR
ncbi:MAG: M48 family metallopeptidase [Candidatus Omnitrophica bacterium]|nr:M48 family metallopeptidase [Candidatus Omnitrophota bacterium]